MRRGASAGAVVCALLGASLSEVASLSGEIVSAVQSLFWSEKLRYLPSVFGWFVSADFERFSEGFALGATFLRTREASDSVLTSFSDFCRRERVLRPLAQSGFSSQFTSLS